MAEFVESFGSEEAGGIDAELSQKQSVDNAAEIKQAEQNAEQLPEKYRGKSVDDIIRMHQEAEKTIGRQAQEVGEVRRLADELLKRELAAGGGAAKTEKPEDEAISDVDFFADPVNAVKKAVENHPAVRQAQEVTLEVKRQKALAQLASEHADFADVMNDSEFSDWLGKSKFRQDTFAHAHANFDVEAASELFTSFKAQRALKAKTVAEGAEAMRTEAQRQLKAASVVAGNGAGESGASKPTYRRADLIQLKITDPERYLTMADEIMAAYAEGRVK